MLIQSLRRAVVRTAIVATLALLPVAATAASGDDVIAVNVDQAKLIKMPEMIATIVVGNPMIADVTIQPGGVVIVTGKGYGATNVIAMDRRGTVLSDRIIQVDGPSDRIVTVFRGVERESYSCTPVCERRATLGDSEKFFRSTVDQNGTFASTASAAAPK